MRKNHRVQSGFGQGRAALPSKKEKAVLHRRLEAAEAEGCPEKGDDSLRKALAFREDPCGPKANGRVRATDLALGGLVLPSTHDVIHRPIP